MKGNFYGVEEISNFFCRFPVWDRDDYMDGDKWLFVRKYQDREVSVYFVGFNFLCRDHNICEISINLLKGEMAVFKGVKLLEK